MWTTRPEARGVGLKEEPKGIFILFFLMSHALRLEPFTYAAVTRDEGNPDGIGTGGHFPTASTACGNRESSRFACPPKEDRPLVDLFAFDELTLRVVNRDSSGLGGD